MKETYQLVKLSLCSYFSSGHCVGISVVELCRLGLKVVLVGFVHALDGGAVHEITIASEDLKDELVVFI